MKKRDNKVIKKLLYELVMSNNGISNIGIYDILNACFNKEQRFIARTLEELSLEDKIYGVHIYKGKTLWFKKGD